MVTCTYNKFQDFNEQLGKGVHQLHAAGHTLMVYLTNNTPNAASHTVKGDLAGITEEHGYAAADINNDYTETGGVGTLTAVDVTYTATGGTIGPFRYAVIYNSSASDRLVAYFDYGSSITVASGDLAIVDFGASVFTIT